MRCRLLPTQQDLFCQELQWYYRNTLDKTPKRKKQPSKNFQSMDQILRALERETLLASNPLSGGGSRHQPLLERRSPPPEPTRCTVGIWIYSRHPSNRQGKAKEAQLVQTALWTPGILGDHSSIDQTANALAKEGRDGPNRAVDQKTTFS